MQDATMGGTHNAFYAVVDHPSVNSLTIPVCYFALFHMCRIIMFVSFWAESSLHNSIADEATKVLSFTDNYTDPAATEIVNTVILLIEGRR